MTRATALVALLLAPVAAFGGKVKTTTASAQGDHARAQMQHVVVSSEGTVRLARQLKPLPAGFDATRVWDVVEDRAGNLYAATGDDGKLFRITPDGQVSVAFDGPDSQVLSLCAAADGSVYAGTGPGGQVVRIDPTGVAKVLHAGADSYVWALACDDRTRTVYAATGPHGRVYRIDADGKAEVFFQSRQNHILSMVRAADGTLYAGTDKQGLVYRIDAQGKGFVLFQAAQAEVRCLQLTAGAVYAGTSSPSGRGASSASSGGPSGSGVSQLPKPATDASPAAAEPQENRLAAATSREKDREPEKPTAAAPVPAPGSGDNSVYRIGFDGSVREVYREKGLILSLLKVGDRLIVGGGPKGQLYEIHEPTRERSEIARLDHGQIQRLLPRRDGSVVVAASDPGKLYTLQDRFAARGTVVSEVIDAKLVSRWGAISWQADSPKGTTVTVSARSGNVAEPDDTWSDWSAELTDAKQSAASVPAARYFQYRITLATADPAVTPALRSLSVRHATLNQAPEVTSLDMPNIDAAAAKEPKRLRFKWTATDANEDELSYDLYVRKDGWAEWVKVEDDWSKTEYEWDTTTMPSGTYQFKVVASDRPDNNAEAALVGERVGGPVVVAHEPPVATVKAVSTEKGVAVFEANGTSGLVRLTAASYALDGGRWVNVAPTDGLFDAKAEAFRFPAEGLKAGTHVLVFRVRDAAGNTGTADVVFTVKGEK